MTISHLASKLAARFDAQQDWRSLVNEIKAQGSAGGALVHQLAKRPEIASRPEIVASLETDAPQKDDDQWIFDATPLATTNTGSVDAFASLTASDQAGLDSFLQQQLGGQRQAGGGQCGVNPYMTAGGNATNELHNEAIKRIEAMGYSFEDARVVKAAIYRMVKTKYSDLSSLKRAEKMLEYVREDIVRDIDIPKIRAEIQAHLAAKNADSASSDGTTTKKKAKKASTGSQKKAKKASTKSKKK